MKYILLYIFVLGVLYCKGQQAPAPMSIAEAIYNNTVKIVGYKDTLIDRRHYTATSIGTGFFFRFVIGQDTVETIVTNYHVIAKCNSGVLRFNSARDSRPAYGDILQIRLDSFSKLWLKHPTEDLAIIFLTPLKRKIFELYKKYAFSACFTESNLPSDSLISQLYAIEDVIMIGYPKGFSDTVNNLPIPRKGITASPISLNYNGKPRFLLDIPIYSGSSGSPVILYNQSSYVNGQGTFVVGQSRIFLLGIVAQAEDYEAIGKSTSNQIKQTEVRTKLPFDIAVAIKSSMLNDFRRIIIGAEKDPAYFRLLQNALLAAKKL